MRSSGRRADRLAGTLAILSTAVVAVVLFAMGTGFAPTTDLPTLSLMPVIALNVGIVAALVLGVVHYRGKLAETERRLSAERKARAAAGRERDAASTIVGSDPAAIVIVEPGADPRLVTVPATAALPRDLGQLLAWESWLQPKTAQLLSLQTHQLITGGRGFETSGLTLTGQSVEIEGSASAAGAVLRIRDVSQRQQDLVELQQRTARQAQELKLWRGLADTLPLPVWLRGSDGRLNWVNMTYVKAVDALSRDDVRIRQVEWLDERQRQALADPRAVGGGRRQRMLVAQGSERRAFDVSTFDLGTGAAGAAVPAAPEKAATGPGLGIDVTLDRVATAVAIFGPDQRLEFANQAFRALWRLEPDWLAARPRLGEVLDRLRESRQLPEETDYRAWKRRQLRTVTEHVEFKDSWHLPNGHTVDVCTVPRADGGVACLYDDVTERIGQERRLNAMLHVQSETLDHLTEGVAVFGTDGKLRLYNSAFARIWSLDPALLALEPHVEEVLLRCQTLYDHAETWNRIHRAVTGIVEQRERIAGEMHLPSGSVISYAGLPLPDGALLMTFADVTDAQRAEHMLKERNAALETANEALKTADKLKDDFVSHVSYELRVPLQSIIGFSDLLSSPVFGPLNAKQREYVEDIAASSRTLLSIINDILDLATIDAGAFELKLARVPVERVIHAAAAGVAERVARARLDLQISIAPDVVELVADENRLKQVLYNLLSNATGFSEEGDAVALQCRREGDTIVFEVEDEGVGIPHDQQKHVFDRFVSRTHGSRHRGAGLGLAMVRSLVELHGGTISLTSEPGMGTRVTVRLPERPATTATDPRTAGRSGRGREAA